MVLGTFRRANGKIIFVAFSLNLKLYRYANMDYIFASSMQTSTAFRNVISYDINCSWSKHLQRRLLNLPPHIRMDINERQVDYVIPKFHLPAHGASCQSRYSLNYRPHMGRTDGENIERGWAWMNPASLSTWEMGPGTRQDALDDQWSFWNWRIFACMSLSSPVLVLVFVV